MGNCDAGRFCENTALEEQEFTLGSGPVSSSGLALERSFYIYSVGGVDRKLGGWPIASAERLCINKNGVGKWELIASLSKPRLGACVGIVNNKLYAMGGWSGTKHDTSVESIDLFGEHAAWVSEPAMNDSSTFANSATVGGNMYVCGGMTSGIREGKQVLWTTSAVKMLDCSSKQWSRLPAMKDSRLGPAVAECVLNGTSCIVAIGGVNGEGDALSSCEVLDLTTRKWSYLPNLPSVRAAACVVAYKDTIYVLGGCGIGGTPVKSCLMLSYDGSAWLKFADMIEARGGFGASMLGSIVMAVGGDAHMERHLRSTEMCDLDSDITSAYWRSGPEMNVERRYPGVTSTSTRELA